MPPKKTKAKSDEPETNTMDLTEKVQALVMEASAVRKPAENNATLLHPEATINQFLQAYLLVDNSAGHPQRRVFTKEEVKTRTNWPPVHFRKA